MIHGLPAVLAVVAWWERFIAPEVILPWLVTDADGCTS